MAELWLGVEPDGSRIAMKRLLPSLLEEGEVQALFDEEMRVTAKLDFPGICRVLDVGREGQVPWLKLELLEGDSLAAVSARAREVGSRWPAALGAFVTLKTAEALAHAHALGVVHRDVSPNNVFVCWSGDVKVLDFGIAHAVGRAVKTQTGAFRGRLDYAAPEHVRGDGVDARADQFALGATAFELLTGTRLHARQASYALFMVLTEQTAPFPRADAVSPLVPPKLADLVARLLERRAQNRFGSMGEVAAALQAWLAANVDPSACDAPALSSFVHAVCGPRIEAQRALYAVGARD
jgi:serine/threonine protein kinase